MPQVIISAHAALRCREQGIGIGVIRSIVAGLPPGEGEVHWTERGRYKIIVKYLDGDIRMVVTVIGIVKLKRGYKHDRRMKGGGLP
jgi:hypothetical protein